MFDARIYAGRREVVRKTVGDGLAVFLGLNAPPRNYRDNVYPYRQDSHVLYYSGLSRPGIALVLGGTEDLLFGPAEELDDVVWYGPHEGIDAAGRKAGFREVRDIAGLGAFLGGAMARGRRIHWLPPYREEARAELAALLGLPAAAVGPGASRELVKAVADQRLRKSDAEIAEIEDALAVTKEMHVAAMRKTRVGESEASVAAAAQAVAIARDRAQAYNPIVTVHGEVLHNNSYANRLEKGQLLLIDAGAESPRFYASDITRVFPVDGRWTKAQREIYQVVLDVQLAAIDAIRPGVRYRDVHLLASRRMAEGLKGLGLMRGDAGAAVEAGAHALFFPHGLGHMLGLDVHDMEDLGDVVGYPEGEARSRQFGLNYLRMSRALEPGFVFTVEPGIYFIPALIDRWEGEGRHREFIDYERVRAHRGLGGIRIEDDVLCTPAGARVLGPAIPKDPDEVQRLMGAA